MSEFALTHEEHDAVFNAVLRTLRAVQPGLVEAGRALEPGGLVDLDSHIDQLVAIVRRTTANTIEPYLAQILEDVCSKCSHQCSSGFCLLRHENRCVLYTHAEPIVRAVLGALCELQDEAYRASHGGRTPRCSETSDHERGESCSSKS